MPPIPPGDLKVGTMYVIVFNDKKTQEIMEFRSVTEEGYLLFKTKNGNRTLQHPELEKFYEVGATDIPAVGGRRSRKVKRKAKRSKAKRSRKNRNRK
jgi:hypothetical protein